MTILLTGPNEYRIKESVDRLVVEHVERDGPDGVVRSDGTSLAVADLDQLLTGGNLFAPRQLIILRDASKNKPIWEKLGEYAEKLDESTSLVVVEPSPDKRTRTYKQLEKHGQVRKHEALSERELISWIQTTARADGVNIEVEAARFLVGHAGFDQWRLSTELGKLSSLGKTVTPELIRDIVEPEPQANAFELLDAALSSRIEVVTRQLTVLRTSEEPYRFFGLLVSQVAALVVCATAAGQPPATIAKTFGIHPFIVKKTLAMVQSLPHGMVDRVIDIVADTDIRMKSSSADPWLLIELCLGEISTLKKT